MKITGMLVAGSILMGGALGAHAQIMKCVGKDGRVEFAQNCPPGTKELTTGVSSRPAAAPVPMTKGDGKSDAKGEAKPKTLADRDAEFRKRQAEQKKADEKSAKSTAEVAERQRVCQAAQGQLISLRDRRRMVRTDPATGERIVFEEADYQREQAVAERLAAENCR